MIDVFLSFTSSLDVIINVFVKPVCVILILFFTVQQERTAGPQGQRGSVSARTQQSSTGNPQTETEPYSRGRSL